jgi:hypothetical protein
MRYAFLREPLEPTDVAVIWLGRSGTADPATVPSIKDIAARVPSGRYLVLSILPRVYFEYEAPGTRAYQNLTALNDELAAAFADRFLPVGGDIGPADHSDEMHLNTRGYAKVARIVYDALVARGW